MLQNRPNGEDKDVSAALPGGSGSQLITAPEQPRGKRSPSFPSSQRPPEKASFREPPPGPGQEELTTVYDVTCPRCGNVYKSDAHFCRKCGHKRSEASVVVTRPLSDERGPDVSGQYPPTAYSSGPKNEQPWGYPPGQQRTPSPSPMGFAQSRYFNPEPSSNKYSEAPPGYASSGPQNPVPRSMSRASASANQQNALQRSMSHRSEAPAALSAPGPPGPPGPGLPGPPGGMEWPTMGGGFMGPYGQFPYDANANMYNMWPTNHGGENAGAKNYVVLCKDDVEVRASPTYSDDARIGQLLHPGQVVVVDEKRMVSGSWFLHLADGRGWVFERKEHLLVMTEVQDFERGLWHYSVVCEDDVETRISPTYSDDARTGIILSSGDTVACDERCRVAGARFLKLADGRGWVFETRDRLLVFSEVRSKPQEARDFERGLWHYSVVCDDDVEIRAAPTYSDEARTGLMVHPGDCVAIDERCRVAAVWYLRLSDGRGWVFESKDSRRVMMQMH